MRWLLCVGREESSFQNLTMPAPWPQTSSLRTVRTKFLLSNPPAHGMLLLRPQLTITGSVVMSGNLAQEVTGMRGV